VVLVAGRGSPDRDALSLGAPAMAELAGILSQAGFVVVRYDNRGVGQSGGRTEAASLKDYAEDTRAVVKWLADRRDIDSKRIAIVGHGEGAWMAILAASTEKRVSALVTLGAPASSGEQLVLEQQRLQLETLTLSESEREAKQALQKQVHAAVLTGRGWEQLPPELRRRADTAWFRSVLEFDPAKAIRAVDAPILIVHGELDREIPAEQLAAAARKGKSDAVEVMTIRGVNHQLTPALTGSVREYPTLADRGVSPEVSSTIAAWLTKTLPARER
jgi:pimeloyl-ACP methyl ester carboxylesterase